MEKAKEIELLQSLKGDTYFAQLFGDEQIDAMCQNIRNDFPIECGLTLFLASPVAKENTKLKSQIAQLRQDAEAVAKCALGLKMYGICLLPSCIKTVLSRAYYAVNDTRRPMVIGVFEVAMNIGLSILLVKKFGILGVVGATAIASIVSVIVMLIDYNRKYINVISKQSVLSYWKIMIASSLLVISFIMLNDMFFYSVLVDFIVKSSLSFLIYGLVLLILREKTLFAMAKKGKSMLFQRIKRMG